MAIPPTTSIVRINDLSLSLDEATQPEVHLKRLAARRLGTAEEDISRLSIVRRALDARRQNPHYVYGVQVAVHAALARRAIRQNRATAVATAPTGRWVMPRCGNSKPSSQPVVVGAGPAGLLAALTLAEAGCPPILIERGKAVEPRGRDVSQLYARGRLDPDSNVCYGEGGAGTFSDGKLYTRIGDPRCRRVLETLVELGAKDDILVDSRPHIGTDRLVVLLAALRARLLALGTEILFETAVSEFDVANGAIRAVGLRDGRRIETRHGVLATGHSSHGVWEALERAGVALEARPFAVGFRVEHPQAMIDEIRYGRSAGHHTLPAADYRLAYNQRGGEQRGIYSFCMCPGGVVVPTPTVAEELCINGMSHAARSGRFANSALVVTVRPDDFAAWGQEHNAGALAGAAFQRRMERAAYVAGGGAFTAPASRVTDFMRGRTSADLPATSYRRGLRPYDLRTLYPEPVISALREALSHFERSMRGFTSAEAKLIGVETRTASPIRLPRGTNLQSTQVRGLYPAGEGMGFGGGILSAAVDGMRAAEALLRDIGAQYIEDAQSP